VSLADAREECLEQNYRHRLARSKSEARRVLNKHFKTLPSMLDEVDDGDIKACLDRLVATPSEQLHSYRYIRCFLRW